jgi:NitT/TauT family transport system permease protein
VAQTLAGNLRATDTYYHLGVTLLRILAGFILSMALGFSLGVLMGGRREFEAFFDVWLVVGLAMPAPAWAMISVLLFGLNQTGTVVAITLLAAPFVTIGIWQGVKAMDMGLIEMARVFGVSRRETLRHVLLPQLTPFLLASARYGFGLCWKVTVLVEMISLGNGVGNVMDDAFHNFEMEQVLAWTVLFTLVMLGIEAGIWKSFERRATRWRPALHLA